MPISPHDGESQSEFMARCVPEMIGTGDDKRPQEQAVAACLQVWRDRDKQSKQIEPEDGESHDEFMQRCVDEIGDEAECEIAWENRQAPPVVHKTHAASVHGMQFILSDETPDRMGNVLMVSGWRLANFKRNPIALFNHSAGAPIGLWKNVRIDDGSLRGRLELAPEGTSDRIDEIRRLVEAGILRAVSVGFKPIKHEWINKEEPGSGFRYLEQELVETSLVSVPANPNALAIAKSLAISEPTMRLVFAEQGTRIEKQVRRGPSAEQGRNKTSHHGKGRTMSLAQRIRESDGRISLLRDSLQQHLDNLDDMDVTEDDMTKRREFIDKIGKETKIRDGLIESEKALGIATATEHDGGGVHEVRMPVRRVESPIAAVRVYPEVARKPHQPGDHLWKALTCLVKLQGERYLKKSHLDVIRDTCGENDNVRTVFEGIIGKAATAPALTTTTGWAAELVRTEYAAWMESLQPSAVAARLLGRGLQFTFGTNGIISIPSRVSTPTIAGSFVGEGAPIPVRQGAFTAVQIIPKKVAVITTFSREISEHSDPQIEGILRQAIVEDTTVAIDSVLLDANAATAVRPPGLRNGVSTLTPTAAGGFAAVVGDIKLAVAALTTSTYGNIRNAVWLMSPLLELALRLITAPNGTWAFRDEIDAGRFAGYPTIVSPNVTADTLYLIDAADLVSASGPPQFSVSDSATVHAEDTTPLQIGTVGTPNVVAAPVRSFWQTDTLGVRMIMNLNWSMRRTGMVQYITGVTWD